MNLPPLKKCQGTSWRWSGRERWFKSGWGPWCRLTMNGSLTSRRPINTSTIFRLIFKTETFFCQSLTKYSRHSLFSFSGTILCLTSSNSLRNINSLTGVALSYVDDDDVIWFTRWMCFPFFFFKYYIVIINGFHLSAEVWPWRSCWSGDWRDASLSRDALSDLRDRDKQLPVWFSKYSDMAFDWCPVSREFMHVYRRLKCFSIDSRSKRPNKTPAKLSKVSNGRWFNLTWAVPMTDIHNEIKN